MKNVEFLGITIVIDGKVEPELINLGGTTLKKDNREYIVDIVRTMLYFKDGQTTLECEVEIDKNMFPDCKFDLTETDLFLYKLDVAEIYVGTEDNDEGIDYDVESATLFVKSGGMTKAIDLEQE